VHPDVSAVGSDKITAVHAELQELKSSLQTRTLWLPALQADVGGLIDWVGGVPIRPWLPGTPSLPELVPGLRVWAPAAPGETAKKSAINNNMDLVMEAPNACVQVAFPT
jgi:hypothetical protein